jgi:hypothetical protein
MRAKEFITEMKLDQVHDALDTAAVALPNAFVIPELKNQDFYDLYRFGVAIADVRGEEGQADGVQNNYKPAFRPESAWGENQIIVSFDPNVGQVIDKALAKVKKHGKKSVATLKSEEMSDTITQSILKPFQGYK